MRIVLPPSPNLSAERKIVVNDPNLLPALRSAHSGRNPGWTSADHQHVEPFL
jgi:hypothetical protein